MMMPANVLEQKKPKNITQYSSTVYRGLGFLVPKYHPKTSIQGPWYAMELI